MQEKVKVLLSTIKCTEEAAKAFANTFEDGPYSAKYVMFKHIFKAGVKWQSQQDWVQVSKSLPDNKGWCNDRMLFVCDGVVRSGCYDYETGDWTETGGGVYKDATHWMPLPETPNI